MTSSEKEELKSRCEALIYGNETRKSWSFSGLLIQKILKATGRAKSLPYMGNPSHKVPRGRGVSKILRLYVKFLIEESLKYPMKIYIPYIGFLTIVEVDPVGKKSLWTENGKVVYRMDTPFDTSVKYWMRSYIFGVDNKDFATGFFLRKRYINPILHEVYKAHPDGGFYEKYGTWKN